MLSTFLTPPPTPQKSEFHVGWGGGGWRGSKPNTHWGMHFLDNIMILQGANQTIQRLQVGYVNRPRKGGYVAFSPVCRPAWL